MSFGFRDVNRLPRKHEIGDVNAVGEVWGHCIKCQQLRWLGQSGHCGTCLDRELRRIERDRRRSC